MEATHQALVAGERAADPETSQAWQFLMLRLRRWLLVIVLATPSLLTILYFTFIAADRFVSEAQFVVRTAARSSGGAGLGALLQMTGLARAQDDVFSVQSFLTSRDAAERLAQELPIREIYGHPDADFLARFPSFIYGPSIEELHRYLAWMIKTTYSSTTGITTLRVQAFRPDDAKAIAALLLDMGEQTVNRMNARIHADAVRLAEAEVGRGEERLIQAQVAITRFRNAELMIDPAGSSIIVTELIGRLSAELAQTEAQIREVSFASPNNPLLPSLRRRTEALQSQILRERERISNASEGLAEKLAAYERLVLDREFAKQTLTAAVKSLEAAQQESRRQQLYLERTVEPMAADHPMAPERLRLIATAVGINMIALLVGWLIVSGLTEHARRS